MQTMPVNDRVNLITFKGQLDFARVPLYQVIVWNMEAMVLANPSNSIPIGTVFYAIYRVHQLQCIITKPWYGRVNPIQIKSRHVFSAALVWPNMKA